MTGQIHCFHKVLLLWRICSRRRREKLFILKAPHLEAVVVVVAIEVLERRYYFDKTCANNSCQTCLMVKIITLQQDGRHPDNKYC